MMTAMMMALSLGAADAPPEMRVERADLDLNRPGAAAELAERIRASSRDFCAEHRALVTPRHARATVCERGMRAAALAHMPEAERAAFRRAGGVALLHRP